jgi:hypothetical protein
MEGLKIVLLDDPLVQCYMCKFIGSGPGIIFSFKLAMIYRKPATTASQ